MENLDLEARRLLDGSLAKSSQATYRGGIGCFTDFRIEMRLNQEWPAPIGHVVHFIAFLSLGGKAPSTIQTYMSALSYVHKINGWVDPTSNFIVQKLKEGSKRLDRRVDSRFPITLNILGQLLNSLPQICKSSYECCLFRAAFCLAFFGFLRVGEFSATSKKGDVSKILAVSDIKIDADQSCLKLLIRFSKTDQKGLSTTLQIGVGPNSTMCPVKTTGEFLSVRPGVDGPLFIHFGGDPLTRYQFSSILTKGIKAIGLSHEDFSPHSFRIGAATSAAMGGSSIDAIKCMGRWQSAAVNSYIRPHKVVLPISWT